MKYPFLVSPQLCLSKNEGDAHSGAGSPLTRRLFIKRTGGVTMAAVLANRLLAVDQPKPGDLGYAGSEVQAAITILDRINQMLCDHPDKEITITGETTTRYFFTWHCPDCGRNGTGSAPKPDAA